MANNTQNLALYKKDPVADGNDTFNITTMLNENWDKIDSFAGKVPQKTAADLTYYVNAATGNDGNDGLTAGTALANIQAAVNKLPQTINNTVTVNVAAGTYAETVAVKGFIGKGYISFVGGASLAAAANYLVNKWDIAYCMASIYISGFKAAADGTGDNYAGNRCFYLGLVNCISDEAVGYAAQFSYGNNYYLTTCQFSNCSQAAVTAYMCRVHAYDCTGSGNAYGMKAMEGGVIALTGAAGFGKRIRGTSGNNKNEGGQFIPTETTGNINIYVRTDGSDDNDGSYDAAGNALRTIAEALRRIPKNIKHIVSVYIAAGTYAEQVLVEGFYGEGQLRIYGNPAAAIDYTRIVNYIWVNKCQCPVMMWNIKAAGFNNSTFAVDYCDYVTLQLCSTDNVDTSYGYGVNCLRSNFVHTYACEFKNKKYGIYAGEGTTVLSDTMYAGSGNVYGLYAERGAKIAKNGGQPAGSTAEATATGGQIL